MDMQIVLFIIGVLITAVGALIVIILNGILTELKELRVDISIAMKKTAILQVIIDSLPCRKGTTCEVVE